MCVCARARARKKETKKQRKRKKKEKERALACVYVVQQAWAYFQSSISQQSQHTAQRQQPVNQSQVELKTGKKFSIISNRPDVTALVDWA